MASLHLTLDRPPDRGDCRRCARVALRNIQIDGQRPRLGRAPPEAKGGPLVAIGNNEGQVVEHCLLTNPRGWAAVHIREGDNLNCAGARIEYNEIVRLVLGCKMDLRSS